jgi:Transglutaminase-like superfamily
MGRLAKFWSLTRSEKKFLCEAIILLLLSTTCVKGIAFRHIDRFLRSRWNDGIEGGIDQEQEIRLVQRSISRAANVLPWKSLCLSRSIAEFIMLRRRGIPAVMFTGVKFSDHSVLEAHAWVDTGLGVSNKSSEHSDFATVIRIGSRSR